ncbi:MAG: hypothetical protein WBV69_04870 [Candidatus Sulfotelmatobacter sp.]
MRFLAIASMQLGAVVIGFGASSYQANASSLSHNAAIQYVSPRGNDFNDGLSWENAKLTGYAACEALVGGSANPPTCGSGTIRIADNVAWGGPLPGGGLYEMGPGDPNYSSPPIGWQRYTGPLTIDCGIPTVVGPHGHEGLCSLLGGGTIGKPGFWLSSLTSFTIRNIAFENYVSQAGRLGIASNGDRSGAGGVSGIFLDGISHNLGACSLGYGPDLDIGSNSFWIYIHAATLTGCAAENATVPPSGLVRESNIVRVTTNQTNDLVVGQTVNIQNATDSTFNGSYIVTSVSGPPQRSFTFAQVGPSATSGNANVFNFRSFAIAIEPGSGSGSGLIFIKEPVFSMGGIWMTPGTNGGSVYIDDVNVEGDFAHPATVPVLVTRIVNPTLVQVNHLEQSDFVNAVPGVEVDGTGQPDYIVVNGAGTVVGPATVQSISPNILANMSSSPRRNGNIGTFGGRSNADTDAARRLFSPVAVRFTNLATTNAASWTFLDGAGSLNPSVADPSGGKSAGRVTSTSKQSHVQFYSSGTIAYGAGDYWIYGAWVRSQSSNGYSNNATPLRFSLNGKGYSKGGLCYGVGGPGTASTAGGSSAIAPAYLGDGQWEFVSGICKIQVGPSGSYDINLAGTADATHVAEFYGPMLLHIPAGTISDNEAWELVTTLQSYSHDCAVGTICGMDGQILHEAAFNVKLGTPASSSDKCTAGTIWADSKFVYVCTATNTIKRSTLSSF